MSDPSPPYSQFGPRSESRMFLIRGRRVMLDSDLAALYGVQTKVFLQAVRRNSARFPDDFMFQLVAKEWGDLRSQLVTSKSPAGGRRYAPFVFTEQGVAMLSSVLNSAQAIAMNIEIMRAFVRFRELIASNDELALRLQALHLEVQSIALKQGGFESEIRAQIEQILEAMRALVAPPSPKKRSIGFVLPEGEDAS